MISVVLADDHVVVRTGIKMLLDADPDIEVVAEAAEGTEAYSLVARYKPDVLLLDISMPPGQSGLIACEKTARDFPDTKVVILTMFAEPEYLLYTLRGGAAGYVLKNSTPEQLRQAVHNVANGGSYIHPTMIELLAKHAAGGSNDPSIQQLSSRELEILQLIARGQRYHQHQLCRPGCRRGQGFVQQPCREDKPEQRRQIPQMKIGI